VHPGALVAAVRSATPPSPIVDTGNAPFTSGPWLFSLNGFVRDFRGPVGEGLRRLVSEQRAVEIDGTSDSEVLFALALDALDAGATPEQALAHVTGAVVGRADAILNLLLCDGHTIVATTLGNSLFALQGSGLARGGVLVASEPLDGDAGWAPVPDRSVVRATCTDLETTALSSQGGPA
jgi:glutamine amidotransferase